MELTLANTMIGVAILFVIVPFLFILTHIDPLTEGEVVQLGTKIFNKHHLQVIGQRCTPQFL